MYACTECAQYVCRKVLVVLVKGSCLPASEASILEAFIRAVIVRGASDKVAKKRNRGGGE